MRGARAGRRRSPGALAPAGAGQHPDDLIADLLRIGVEIEQDPGGHALVLAHQAEQDVLGPDVVVAQAQSLPQRQLEHLLGPGRERDLARGDLLTGADDPDDLRPDALDGDVQRLQHPRGQTLLLAEQPQQDVLSADVVVLERAGLFLGQYDYLTCSLCESLEHGSFSWWRYSGGGRSRFFPGWNSLDARVVRPSLILLAGLARSRCTHVSASAEREMSGNGLCWGHSSV